MGNDAQEVSVVRPVVGNGEAVHGSIQLLEVRFVLRVHVEEIRVVLQTHVLCVEPVQSDLHKLTGVAPLSMHEGWREQRPPLQHVVVPCDERSGSDVQSAVLTSCSVS